MSVEWDSVRVHQLVDKKPHLDGARHSFTHP